MTAKKDEQSHPPKQCSLFRAPKGFTLLELLVVVAIIGVLVSIAIPAYNSYVDKAKVTVAVSSLDTLRKTLESFHIDYQRYPDEIDFTTGLEGMGDNETVLKPILRDQINQDLFINLPGTPDYIYNSATGTYKVNANAKDKQHTPLELTPEATTY